MANVREYLRSKEKRKSGNRNINYKERIRSHKVTSFYRVLLGILLIAAIAAIVFVSWQNRSYSESIVTSSVPVSKVEGSYYCSLGTSILTYSKDGANCMDNKGNVQWNQTYEMQNPMVDVNGSVVAIGDYNGRTIYVMNETGSMGEITTNMPIRNFCVAKNGVVAAILDDANITRINLFDTAGNILVKAETTMDKSGYPIDISISPNGELLAISYFYVDSGKMKSSIAFHNFGEVGQNQSSDRFVSGYDYQGTVVPFIKFINSSTVFAVADDRIMFFTGDQKPTSAAENLLVEEVQSLFYSDQYVGLVFLDTEGDAKYRLDVYNTEGRLVTTKKFDTEYKDIIFDKDDIIIYGDTEYSVSNMQGVERFKAAFEETAYLFAPTEKTNRYIMMTQDGLNIIEMK
ncbi:DUF5711 family protein [Kineothrix sedimenti]|uniref:DUF5711 family protein n=1 Tax=Kineothrix sedimenti TaxID=3123317 RepID=A0ABZ3EW26_9FIRM